MTILAMNNKNFPHIVNFIGCSTFDKLNISNRLRYPSSTLPKLLNLKSIIKYKIYFPWLSVDMCEYVCNDGGEGRLEADVYKKM